MYELLFENNIHVLLPPPSRSHIYQNTITYYIGEPSTTLYCTSSVALPKCLAVLFRTAIFIYISLIDSFFVNRNSYNPQTNSKGVINMTYRGNGYFKFPNDIKTTNKSNLTLVNKEMDSAIMHDKKKLLLRDEPAVKSNQNVYDSLSE
jgi:hypothetical protein